MGRPLPIVTAIRYFGHPCAVACDAKCHKAWGVNGRPKHQLSDDPDDFEWLADDELPDAPADPGTYEGGDGKPQTLAEAHNKWCVRECERSEMVDMDDGTQPLPDFSQRFRNIPEQAEGEVDDAHP